MPLLNLTGYITIIRKLEYCDMTAESGNNGTSSQASFRQRRGKHFSAVTNQHATIDELLEACFLCGPWRNYIATTNGKVIQSEVGVGG
jgi:hypothetical protein